LKFNITSSKRARKRSSKANRLLMEDQLSSETALHLSSHSKPEMTMLYFEEDDVVYSSSFVPFKNTILEIIFEIKNANDWDPDNDNKGSQTSMFHPRF
jgi:hypothetical protein